MHQVSYSNQNLQRKVCGMRSPDNIREILALQPDYLGFIFYPRSGRFVGEALDADLLKQFPPQTKKVGVFVNATAEEILAAVERYALEAVQLHGEESPALCAELKERGLLVFKAFSVDEAFDFQSLSPYEGTCDFYLFDTKGQQYGGNGTTFNWALLQQYNFSTPFFLSGGIDLEHVQTIKALTLPALRGVDINSRFEVSPALKDAAKVKTFFQGLSQQAEESNI